MIRKFRITFEILDHILGVHITQFCSNEIQQQKYYTARNELYPFLTLKKRDNLLRMHEMVIYFTGHCKSPLQWK